MSDRVRMVVDDVSLEGTLHVPAAAHGLVVFVHGSGSSRHSPRNIAVAERLQRAGFATLLFDLLTEAEATDRVNVFDIDLLASRVTAVVQWLRQEPRVATLPIGLFGASTGAAAALVAATTPGMDIAAVVSRGGRPDLAAPADAIDRYPSRFSGGQRQRIAIARALALSPKLVICDEPVSALDLSTQAQVLNLLAELRGKSGLAYLFIAHDLAVVKHLSQRIVVLYRGRIMEEGKASEVYNNPQHPYTKALLAAAPVPDVDEQRIRRAKRASTTSAPSSSILHLAGDGCPFAGRCPWVQEVCKTTRPKLDVVTTSENGIPQKAACHAFDPTSGHTGLQ